MTAPQQKRRPAGETAEAADRNGNAGPAYDQAGGKASTPPPWFRLDASKWRGMTADLKAAERGMLIDLLMQIHQRGEPIINDPARLARACGTTKAAFERALAIFLADGRIVVSAGKLWSHYIEAELDNCEKRSQAAKEKASKRWEKNQQNQSDADAAAMRHKDSKIVEGEASTKPHPSADTISVNDTGPDALLSASGLQVGDHIEVAKFGSCPITAFGRMGRRHFVKAQFSAKASIIVPVNYRGGLLVDQADYDEAFRVDDIKWTKERSLDWPMPSARGGKSHAA